MNVHPKQAEITASREAIIGFPAIVQGKLKDPCSCSQGKSYYNYKLTISLNKETSKNALLVLFSVRVISSKYPASRCCLHWT